MNLIHTLYQPRGDGPYPTILMLHGRGASAFDLLSLAPYLSGGKFLVICPQAPIELPIGPGMLGYAWYSLSMGGPPDVAGMLSSQTLLQTFLDECLVHYPIDAKKLIVLGFSQGGVIAYCLALANPERFAALVALSSWLPPELVAQIKTSDKISLLPTLVHHGTQDPSIEVERARTSVARLRDLKVPVTFKEYDMGHEIRPNSLADLAAWLEKT